MDDSVQAVNHVYFEQIVSVDVKENPKSFSNEHDAANVKNKVNNRRSTRITFKRPYVFLLFYIEQNLYCSLLENIISGW